MKLTIKNSFLTEILLKSNKKIFFYLISNCDYFRNLFFINLKATKSDLNLFEIIKSQAFI